MATCIILLTFLLTPAAADYFAAPRVCWGLAIVLIIYETWILAIKKTPKDIAFEKARVEEARRKVEQIKEEATKSFLQGGGKKIGSSPLSTKDVNSMSEEELALAARRIVQDMRQKKGGGESGEQTLKKAA